MVVLWRDGRGVVGSAERRYVGGVAREGRGCPLWLLLWLLLLLLNDVLLLILLVVLLVELLVLLLLLSLLGHVIRV